MEANNMTGQNLERDCAHFGFTLTEKAGELALKLSKSRKLSKSDKAKIVNTITKAIGILSTDGPFAYIVWLEYRGSLKPAPNNIEENTAQIIHEKSFEVLKHEDFIGKDVKDYKKLRDILIGQDETTGICTDIYQMFFVKSVIEKMLTYALYKAKSLQVDEQHVAESDMAQEVREQ